MRVIIAGSRTIEDYGSVLSAVRESGFEFDITTVVSGQAKGVDLLGARWAEENDIPIERFPVTKEDWDTLGKAAGPLRNIRMAENADALILVWNGESKGSADMLKQATSRGLRIFQFRVDKIG